ncbi:MAG: condensation domain-containing protein [Acutalibacteraceae bacterium]
MEQNTKMYPLTYAQKMHYFTVKYCPYKQVLNIGVSLTIEIDVDVDVLRESIYEAYDHFECSRIRFHENEDGEVMQYIAEKEARYIPYFEFRHWKYEDAESEMRKWTEVPFERQDSPMNKIMIIAMPDGFQGVYFCVDHMTMDAQALIVFLSDIMMIYSHKKYDYKYTNPAKSYIAQLEKDLAYENNSKALQRDRKYWTEVIESSEPMFTDIMGTRLLDEQRFASNNFKLRAAANANNSMEAGIATFHLEPAPTESILRFCKENNVPVVCLLMMALRTYLQKANRNESDISIQSTVSRRATISEKFSGGTRVHFFPCRTVVDLDDTFLEGCRKIQENQMANFRHANFNPIEFMTSRSQYYHLNGQSYEGLSLTYQPLSMRSEEIPADLKYKSNWYSNGVAAQALYLTVSHRPIDNGMDFSFEYKKCKYDHNSLEMLYYYLSKIIFQGIASPNKKVGAIIEGV